MRRPMVTRWTDKDIQLLQQFLNSGATPVRAAAALNRTLASVKNRARMLGTPFPAERKMRKIREARYAASVGAQAEGRPTPE